MSKPPPKNTEIKLIRKAFLRVWLLVGQGSEGWGAATPDDFASAHARLMPCQHLHCTKDLLRLEDAEKDAQHDMHGLFLHATGRRSPHPTFDYLLEFQLANLPKERIKCARWASICCLLARAEHEFIVIHELSDAANPFAAKRSVCGHPDVGCEHGQTPQITLLNFSCSVI
eukprot:729343-Amphidinium_carterae.1